MKPYRDETPGFISIFTISRVSHQTRGRTRRRTDGSDVLVVPAVQHGDVGETRRAGYEFQLTFGLDAFGRPRSVRSKRKSMVVGRQPFDHEFGRSRRTETREGLEGLWRPSWRSAGDRDTTVRAGYGALPDRVGQTGPRRRRTDRLADRSGRDDVVSAAVPDWARFRGKASAEQSHPSVCCQRMSSE